MEPIVKPGVSNVETDYGTTTFESSAEQNLQEALNIRFASSSSLSARNSGAYQNSEFSSRTSLCARTSRRSKDSFVFLSSCRMNVDKLQETESRQILQRAEFFINVINHVLIGYVTIYMTWLCLHTGLSNTSLHAWLVTLGFCTLMAEAIMSHYNGNVLTFNYRRTTKTTIHWVLQAVGGSVGAAGALVKLIQKGFMLNTIHGKLGFSAFILCLVSMLSGLTALFSMRLKRILSPLLNKTFHNFLGIATYVIALAAQYYGYQTGFFSRKVTADYEILMKVITLISLFLSSIGPLKALYHKTLNIIRNF